MSRDLVSVIIPTYKRSDFIVRAINSVLNQTYKTLEIIVVDDNNEDDYYRNNTKKILKKFIEKQEIIYLEHKVNKGISAARNTGIKKAKGKFISFLDDDDEFLPNKTIEQLNIFKKSSEKVGLVYGSYIEINSQNNKQRVISPNLKKNVFYKLGINHIGPPSMVMFSKKAIEKIGEFDVNLNHKEDIDYYYRLSEYFEVSYTEEILAKYYIHPGGSSKNDKDRLEKMLRYIDKHHIAMKKPNIRWSEVQERLGDLNILNCKKRDAFISYMIAYKIRPLRFKILIKAVLLLFK